MPDFELPLRERIVQAQPFTREEVVDEFDTLQDQINDLETVLNDVLNKYETMVLADLPTNEGGDPIDENGEVIPEEDLPLCDKTRGSVQSELNNNRQVIRDKATKRRGKDKQKHQNIAKGGGK
jgi:hypothetical protein